MIFGLTKSKKVGQRREAKERRDKATLRVIRICERLENKPIRNKQRIKAKKLNLIQQKEI